MAPLKLKYDARGLREQYVSAEPFPHIVVDGLFDDPALETVLRDFPDPKSMRWVEFDSPQEKKLGYSHERSNVSKVVRDFLNDMNSFEMLVWLEALTGIEGLIPDPYFGGGACIRSSRADF